MQQQRGMPKPKRLVFTVLPLHEWWLGKGYLHRFQQKLLRGMPQQTAGERTSLGLSNQHVLELALDSQF